MMPVRNSNDRVRQALAVWPAFSTPSHHIDMSQTSSSSSFRSPFDAALRDYAKKTGTYLDDHPLAKELQICDSVDSISTVLRKQAQRFHEFRGEDGKVMKPLNSVVHVLYYLFNGSALGEGIGTVCPKALVANVLSLMCVSFPHYI